MHVTPLGVTTFWPGTVVATLPPASAARSTVTEPAPMDATMSSVIMTGALRPGISAVVTMTSTSAACLASISAAAACHSADISLA